MALLWAAGVITCLLIAPLYIVYKPPSILIRYFQQQWPDVLWHVSTKKKTLALTIDDSPSEHTQEIMEILEANKVTATFFLIGDQVPGREDILQDLIRGGHELGNHAMHDQASWSLTDGNLAQQVMTVQTMIGMAHAATGIAQSTTRFFRPGSGFFTSRMRSLLSRMEYRIVLGSVYPYDPQIPYWRMNASHILSMARPGSIIICHDRRSWTAPMLRKVLPDLRRQGYQIVTLSKLLANADT